MTRTQQPASPSMMGQMSLQQMYEMGLSLIGNVCSIVTLPVEYVLRPQFGTRYFNPILTVFSCAMMLALGGADAISGMLPFGRSPAVHGSGLVGLGLMTLAFFVGNVIHGTRLYVRMLHMELEKHSEFEGPALPFFALFPYGKRFWPVRIFYEPMLVMVGSIALWVVGILDRPAALYLAAAAMFLSLKNCLEWYKTWLQIRILMDAKAAAPVMAAVSNGTATEDDLASVHMAGFPKNIPPQIKAAALSQMRASLPPEIEQLVSPVEVPAAA